MIKIGQAITYVDSMGRRCPALVTHVGIPDRADTWLNIVTIVLDEKQTDSYGRKTERYSSVPHYGHYGAAMPGNYWTGE